jgi:hypothetical protein
VHAATGLLRGLQCDTRTPLLIAAVGFTVTAGLDALRSRLQSRPSPGRRRTVVGKWGMAVYASPGWYSGTPAQPAR